MNMSNVGLKIVVNFNGYFSYNLEKDSWVCQINQHLENKREEVIQNTIIIFGFHGVPCQMNF